MQLRFRHVMALLLSSCCLMVAVQAQEKQDAGETPASPKTACPGRLDGFVNGVSSATDIKACLHQEPAHEDHNPDGRFVYLYNLRNGIVVTYLFDANGLLLRTNAYRKD